MAKIICTQAEYDKLTTVLEDNPQFLADVRVIYDIVREAPTIPEDYIYDTETDEFLVYRHKYTGKEIHIIKDPDVYLLKPTERRVDKHREFPEYIGKHLKDLVKDKYPGKVGDTHIYGVCGCPHDYTFFSRDYCLCNASGGNCSDCWNQIYTGYYKED